MFNEKKQGSLSYNSGNEKTDFNKKSMDVYDTPFCWNCIYFGYYDFAEIFL
jgi:hypothetical protein